MYIGIQDLIITSKPMPSKYSNKLLLSSSEKIRSRHPCAPDTGLVEVGNCWARMRSIAVCGFREFIWSYTMAEEVAGVHSLPHLPGPKSKT